MERCANCNHNTDNCTTCTYEVFDKLSKADAKELISITKFLKHSLDTIISNNSSITSIPEINSLINSLEDLRTIVNNDTYNEWCELNGMKNYTNETILDRVHRTTGIPKTELIKHCPIDYNFKISIHSTTICGGYACSECINCWNRLADDWSLN